VKKQILQERFQELAGIKPLYTLESENEYQEIIVILTEVYIQTTLPKGVLRENINEISLGQIGDKIKSGLKDFSDTSKKTLKKILPNLSKQGLLAKLVKDLNQSDIKDYKELLSVISLAKSKFPIKEDEEGGETPGVNDLGTIKDKKKLETLKDYDTFTWGGADDPSFEWKGEEVAYDNENEKGLKKGIQYIKTPEIPLTDEFTQPSFLQPLKDFEGLQKKHSSIITTLREFFDKNPIGKGIKVLLIVFAALSTVQGVMADTAQLALGDLVKVLNMNAPGGGTTYDDDYGKTQQDSEISDDEAEEHTLKQGEEVEGGETLDKVTSPEKVIDGIKANNVNVGDLSLVDDENTSIEAQTYEVGEGSLSQDEINEFARQLVEKILEDLNAMVEKSPNQKLNSINLTINAEAGISYNGGDQSNVANDGGDLLQQRLESSEKIANAAAEDIKEIIKNAYGDKVEINVEINKVDTSSGVDDQKTQKTQDFLSTQSSIQSADIDVETSETGTPSTLLKYQFLYDKEKPTAPPVIAPIQIKKDIKKLGELNRNGQIALLLRTINANELNIYKEIGEESVISFTDSELRNIAEDEKSTEKAKILARIIPHMRKNPDTMLRIISGYLGIKTKEKDKDEILKIRARAKSLPGDKYKGMFRKRLKIKKEEVSSLKLMSLLIEGKIDDLLDKYKNDTRKNHIAVLTILGGMYAEEGTGGALSILNIDRLSNSEKKEMEEYGWEETHHGDYIFLGDEAYATLHKPKSGEEKLEKDVENIVNFFEKNSLITNKLNMINDKEELQSVLSGILNYVQDRLQQNKAALKSTFFKVRNQIKEEEKEKPDVINLFKVIDSQGTLKTFLDRITNIKELEQLIVHGIIPNLNPSLTKNPSIIKSAIVGAVNTIKTDEK
jgi:hypothetical protein